MMKKLLERETVAAMSRAAIETVTVRKALTEEINELRKMSTNEDGAGAVSWIR